MSNLSLPGIFRQYRIMRLYLSSYRIGECADQLLALMGRKKRTCIISNALDFLPGDKRREFAAEVYDPKQELATLGIAAEELDLRAYFDGQNSLEQALCNFDLVWVSGGNSFLLMRAMIQSGFGKVIRTMLAEDVIVYGGFSAGVVVATPTLRGIDLMDDPDQIAGGYSTIPVWDGLGLVDFSIVPHFRSDHPESPSADKAVAYFKRNNMPFRTLRDGEVLIMNAQKFELCPKQTSPQR